MNARSVVIVTLILLGLCYIFCSVNFKSPAEKQAYIEKQAATTRAVLDKFMAGEAVPVSQVWFTDEHGFVNQPAVEWMQRTLVKSTNVTFTAEEFEALRNAETVRVIRRKRTIDDSINPELWTNRLLRSAGH